MFQELLVLETDFGYDLSILKNASWLIRCPVSDVQSVNLLKRELDAGESEAIVLAKELQADFLLIDESEGRTIALREGLQIIGLLGVLIQAKHRKLIPAIKPVVAELRQIAGFYLSESLVQNILQQMGE